METYEDIPEWKAAEDDQFNADDAYFGYDDLDVDGLADEEIAAGGAETGNVSARTTRKPEKPIAVEYIPIDDRLNDVTLMNLVRAEINRRGPAGHHKLSLDSFYSTGIAQIIKYGFAADIRVKNGRQTTEEDLSIAETQVKIEFTSAALTNPTTEKPRSGKPEALTPAFARESALTYSAPLIIDAVITATATLKDGSTRTRTETVKDFRIAKVPCAIGSVICTTHNCTTETLRAIGEDPRDLPGSFCIEGGTWRILSMESVTFNMPHAHKQSHKRSVASLHIISKSGDAFENSFRVILNYLEDGAIIVTIPIRGNKQLEIPFHLLYKILGMTSERDIVNTIVYGVEFAESNLNVKTLCDIVEAAFAAPDKQFAKVLRSNSAEEILTEVSRKITPIENESSYKNDEVVRYVNNATLAGLDKLLLPHLGKTPEHRIKKCRFLGHMINRLLLVWLEIVPSTDRDSYAVKRLSAAGNSYAKSFKTTFNTAIISELRKHFIKSIEGAPFSQLQLGKIFCGAVSDQRSFEGYLRKCITLGNKDIEVSQTKIHNRIASQQINYKNDANGCVVARTITTPNNSAAKQTDRAAQMRMDHATYTGYLCHSHSTDGGESLGLVKGQASTSTITLSSSSAALKEVIETDPDVMLLDDVTDSEVTAKGLAKIFVNGDWIGFCQRPHEIAARYREARRRGEIHYETTIYEEYNVRELHFWCDAGRIVYPLVIVHNNFAEYMADRQAHPLKLGEIPAPRPDAVKFHQWISLTQDHINQLVRRTLTIDDLREMGIIEYISPEEQMNCYVAESIDVLRAKQNDIRNIYTHMGIPQQYLGIVTMASPFPNHSGTQRNTMFINHRKQCLSWFGNFPTLNVKGLSMQWYLEYPLVTTFPDTLLLPGTQNTEVVFLPCGNNSEDSIEVCQASIDNGMFNASYFTHERTELEPKEVFGPPDVTNTRDTRRGANYEKLDGAFARVGSIVEKGDVLIAKLSQISKPTDQYIWSDRSITSKREEPVRVVSVTTAQGSEGKEFARVKTCSTRPLRRGDKLSSRHGNKGIVGMTTPASDFPYTACGLRGDIIVNPHSTPTRMAVNQLIEGIFSMLAARRGVHIDGTIFRKYDIDGLIDTLKTEYGIDNFGKRRMFDGRTGKFMDALIFIVPNAYQRLQKFIIDEHYAMNSGPTSAATRQPLDGKAKGGGLRAGEMEKDVICAHGTMRTLHRKFNHDSDGFDIHICRRCGERAIVNIADNIFKCKRCGDLADIATVDSTFVANAYFAETAAMGVKMTFGLEPRTFETQ